MIVVVWIGWGRGELASLTKRLAWIMRRGRGEIGGESSGTRREEFVLVEGLEGSVGDVGSST